MKIPNFVTGLLTKNRKNFPKYKDEHIKSKKMIFLKCDNGIILNMWYDKRIVISYSTYYGSQIIWKQKYDKIQMQNIPQKTPLLTSEYN